MSVLSNANVSNISLVCPIVRKAGQWMDDACCAPQFDLWEPMLRAMDCTPLRYKQNGPGNMCIELSGESSKSDNANCLTLIAFKTYSS